MFDNASRNYFLVSRIKSHYQWSSTRRLSTRDRQNQWQSAFSRSFLTKQVKCSQSIPEQLRSKTPLYFGDYAVRFLLDGHAKWDSEHFIDIALHGYQNEHKMAFFPFYPGTMKVVSTLAYYPTCWILSDYYRMVLSGWLVSMFFSSVACSILYVRIS